MIDLFVKRPAMSIVLVSVFVILGLFSYNNLIIESSPKIDFPIVSITTIYPGATTIEIEAQIIKKVEDAISEISDIKAINGMIRDNYGMVMIEFNLGVDVNIKAIEVKDKIEQILNDFPPNAKKPVVAKFDPLVIPIQELILSSTAISGKELYQMADKIIRPQLTTVPGVASVDISGGQIRQINIQADRNLLQKHFVTMSDIASALNAKNMNVPSGVISSGETEISVRFQGEFSNLAEISNMPIVTHDGIELKLSQIAIVEDSTKKIESISRFNGQEAVSLSINKLSDGDAVSVARSVTQAVSKLSAILPSNVKLEVVFDSTKRVMADTQSTITNIWLGVLLTVVILFMFLGNPSITLIAALVIPTSIISTFLLVDFSNFTINMMTLLAIATALGTLIANAIVIIETVVKKMEAGSDSINAAIDGTKEIFTAVLASTGTNLVVFTPIAFMDGIVGQFMKQFGLTVVYATIFSLLASFTLTPMLCAVVFRNYHPNESNNNGSFFLLRILRRLLVAPTNWVVDFLLGEIKIVFDLIFRYPKTTILLSFLLCCSPILIISYLGNEFTAQVDQDLVRIKVEMPQGTSLLKTQQVVEQIEVEVKKIPQMTSYLSLIGEEGVENATTIINLKNREDRSKSDVEIINDLIPPLAAIPDAKITFAAGEGHGPGAMGDITINIYGQDYHTLLQLSEQVQKIMLVLMEKHGE